MKRKQIVVLGLVLVIISVGILQYNYNTSGESALFYGDGDDLDLAQGTDIQDIPGAAIYVENTEGNIVDDVLAQQQTTGFFAEARMERDKARSKQKDELKTLAQGSSDGTIATSSSNITSVEAQEQLLAIIRRSDAESTIETLVKQTGFEDTMVYMSETDNIDVLVKAASLTSQEVARISDIVVRHANVTMDKITIKNLN